MVNILRIEEHNQSIHEGKRFPCNRCKFQAAYKITLKSHKICTHEENIIKAECDSCGHEASNKWNFNKHNKRFHTDQLFKCHHCGDTEETIIRLWSHLETVHSGACHKCDECDEQFQSSYSLALHMVKHEKKKNVLHMTHAK